MRKILFLLLITSNILLAQNIKFIIKSDFPKENVWIKQLLQKSAKSLNKMFLSPNTHIPKKILVTIKKDVRVKGIRGNAAKYNNSINFTSNVWQKDKYRIWIMIHELVNLMSAYYGGSGGYPSDWWSNGRSPFPEYVSVLIMAKTGHKQEALWRKDVHKDKPDHKFYWALHRKYGSKLFKNFFYNMRKYNIDLSKIGKPWPHPDKQRSLITLALLSMSAKKNLADMAHYYKIGTKPKDWHNRHANIPFIPYNITREEITETIEIIKY